MVRRGARYNLSQFMRPAMAAKRRVVVRRDDVLVLNGFEIGADVLLEITKPNKRLLWQFIQSEDGLEIRPIAYSEDRVIWLTDEDLVRPRSEVI